MKAVRVSGESIALANATDRGSCRCGSDEFEAATIKLVKMGSLVAVNFVSYPTEDHEPAIKPELNG